MNLSRSRSISDVPSHYMDENQYMWGQPMNTSNRRTFKQFLLIGSGIAALCLSSARAQAQAADAGNTIDVETVIVTSEMDSTHSAVEIGQVQAQKILPGVSPLKAIETLPGVLYETADPWGNNEQNESLVVHGFTTQQLGYTMDGVPLGDQQYGNYNGLSPSRAISSENVAKTILSSGAGSVGVASTSNLGGAIETFSSDPSETQAADVRETGGSYDTTRTFLRYDTGDMGDDSTAYVSLLHHDARAWDFDGHQRDDQANVKFVHKDQAGRLTAYLDWQSKVEPNEDADAFGNQQAATSTYFPYTRPFLFPNYTAALAAVTNGTPPAAQGNNFSNYDSAAQREDVLGYVQYDWNLMADATWSNQVYYHNDSGRGIVAGPVNQAGLPGLFAIYYPNLVVGGNTTSAATLTNIVNVFGGTGYEVRTTEYRINRGGERSTFNWQLGDHAIEAGAWFEYNASSTARRWYAFSAANTDLTPYQVPTNPNFTQYYVTLKTDDLQMHIQDEWQILPDVKLQIADKASLQRAGNHVVTQQLNLPTTNPPVVFPTGSITTDNFFLPQFGAVWEATDHEEVFVNIQRNLRQIVPYAAGGNFYGASPWSLGSQAAFDTFKATAKPETSWTYEAGLRSHRDLDLGPITSVQGQVNYYHVDFYNRLFNVAAYNFINPNPSVLINVGGVTTDGVDLAATLNFGDHFHLYDAISYNRSTYNSNYSTATGTNGTTALTTVAIAGKVVPLVPSLLNKFIASVNFGNFDAQLSGDLVGKRYVTYLNDLSVPSTFQLGLEAGYNFDLPADSFIHKLKLSGNVTNLNNITGVSTANVTGPSGGYTAYPIAPRMGFVTVEAGL
jgi:outer membrane receptor protein involved in Fe transport